MGFLWSVEHLIARTGIESRRGHLLATDGDAGDHHLRGLDRLDGTIRTDQRDAVEATEHQLVARVVRAGAADVAGDRDAIAPHETADGERTRIDAGDPAVGAHPDGAARIFQDAVDGAVRQFGSEMLQGSRLVRRARGEIDDEQPLAIRTDPQAPLTIGARDLMCKSAMGSPARLTS